MQRQGLPCQAGAGVVSKAAVSAFAGARQWNWKPSLRTSRNSSQGVRLKSAACMESPFGMSSLQERGYKSDGDGHVVNGKE